MNYLAIDGNLLKNTKFNPSDKIVISYLRALQQGGKRYFGNLSYMSRELGIRLEYLKERIMKMAEYGIVVFSNNDITLSDDFDEICFFDPDDRVKFKIEELAAALVKKMEA